MSEHRLPLIPVMETVLFPQIVVPLSLQRPRSIAAAQAGAEAIVVTQRSMAVADPGLSDLYLVGVRGRVASVTPGASSTEMRFEATRRVRLRFLHAGQDFSEVEFDDVADAADGDEPEVEALRRVVLDELAQFLTRYHMSGINLARLQETSLPGQIYILAMQLGLPWKDKQQILQSQSHREALTVLRQHLTYESHVRELKERLLSQANQELERQQREHVLRQELANIQKELGEDPATGDLQLLRQKLESLKLPPLALQEATRQLHQLERMLPASSEYFVGRTYLELLVDLPWSEHTQDVLDIPRARQILEEDHYGLADVKERLLEYLAVMRLNPQAHAPILCFVGPPGTGKTSLGMSIARALGRKFERLSLGGMHDEGELRGHRRTYVGAMSGRVIQAIRRSKVNNPLLMLDEVDKLNRSFEGDPAAALLEILDPAQNHEFHDNYLDVPFDLSKVFFITTANTVEGIPGPLLDRLEVIRLSGYSPEEKVEIASRHLLPKQLKETGMADKNVSVPQATLDYLITHYTSEAGVRNLERQIAKLIRRLALRLSEGGQLPAQVDQQEAFGLLGRDEMIKPGRRLQLDVGVAAGMAYTDNGGELIYIEVSSLPEGESVVLTGNLGDIMKESARTARSYLVGHPGSLPTPIPPVHIHVPAGATPKDGPSAGLAMVCAQLSAHSGLPCRADTAMTGEVTLCGLVLPVGGVKEKILAAHRAGLERVVLPRDNAHSLEELPEKVRSEMQFVLVGRIEEALPEVFRQARLAGLPGAAL
jgi:ATP-dependent Lon protease